MLWMEVTPSKATTVPLTKVAKRFMVSKLLVDGLGGKLFDRSWTVNGWKTLEPKGFAEFFNRESWAWVDLALRRDAIVPCHIIQVVGADKQFAQFETGLELSVAEFLPLLSLATIAVRGLDVASKAAKLLLPTNVVAGIPSVAKLNADGARVKAVIHFSRLGVSPSATPRVRDGAVASTALVDCPIPFDQEVRAKILLAVLWLSPPPPRCLGCATLSVVDDERPTNGHRVTTF